MKYVFIQENEAIFPIEKMCQALAVSSGSYYKYKRCGVSVRQLKKQEILSRIRSIYFATKQRYGSPRIAAQLHSTGCGVSRITVAKYMRELGLRSKLSRKFRATTDSKHS